MKRFMWLAVYLFVVAGLSIAAGIDSEAVSPNNSDLPPGSFRLLSPANNAINQSSFGNLTWSSSANATSYDVYFGTRNPPPLYRSNVFGTSEFYNGRDGETYYWYVVAKNSEGSTECDARFGFSTTPLPPGSFALTSPANNATNQPTFGDLRWNSSANATSYDVYFGTNNPPPLYRRDVTGTSEYYNGRDGETYYWYVVAKNSGGSRESNARFSFSTPPLPPGSFNLTAPANRAKSQPTTGTLSWTTSANATSYDVYFGTFVLPSLYKRDVTTTSTSYSGTNGQTYYWYVVAKNSSGQRESQRFEFETAFLPPGSFSLLAPSNNATNQPTVGDLVWGTSTNATSYDVYFGTSNPPPLYRRDVTWNREMYFGRDGETYNWYVVAKNSGGEKESSARFSFSTPPLPPGSFSLTSPANNATNQPVSGMLAWNSSANATSYDVYFGTSNPPPLLRSSNSTSTGYSGALGQTYYWYVVAKNNTGSKECNTRFSFSTLPPTGLEEPDTHRQELSEAGIAGVFPNPFQRSTSIAYALGREGRASLSVLNIVGMPVRTLETGVRSPGLYRAIWDGTDDQGTAVPEGIYFVVLKAEQQTWQAKVLKTH